MEPRSVLGELAVEREELLGDPGIRVAVLDGPVDLGHPCFAGADLTRLDTLVPGEAGPGPMSVHGTHVASLLFGQPGSPVEGLVPRCTGLIVPVFPDGGQPRQTRVSQLDLARAIENALLAGAHVINISGGERTPDGEPDSILAQALRHCADDGVLVVAATGNDGCECVQVPGAVRSVLAVGAAAPDGTPLESSNWGTAYRRNGVLAPGERIAGAEPGGGVRELTGSSFATPLVSGAAALLLSAQLRGGWQPDPAGVGRVILDTATPCEPSGDGACERFLAGGLHVARAHDHVTRGRRTAVTTSEIAVEPAPGQPPEQADPAGVAAAGEPAPPPPPEPPPPPAPPVGVRPSEGGSSCSCGGGQPVQLIYAIGTIGFDYRTEARRDRFRQQMDRPVSEDGSSRPVNPYDPNQLAAYLTDNPWASDKVTWTLNLERTPIYALEAEMPVGMDMTALSASADWRDRVDAAVDGSQSELKDLLKSVAVGPALPVSHVYRMFRDAIVGQVLPEDSAEFISRVSIPGVLTNRTVRLFSGQVVPVVEVKSTGIHTWNEAALVHAAVGAVKDQAAAQSIAETVDDTQLAQTIRALLDKVYYQFRNLGQTPADRAMNYAGTNAFMIGDEIKTGLLSGSYVPGQGGSLYTLDTVTVSKSPYDRIDSDSWDVVVSFFDPENDRRARVSYLFTIDVSDDLPVSLAPAHRFLGGL
ncbi:S8 family serine peptidase [Amycolatopsis acidicola]|uniref:S8 family serine peptidase n=1 Tax=Amycolatopsis acidicola TaxID=2596893 RepID=A0A5N0USR2_9PSEU|nr:S8 family serine peptidase [Amycolatopsis acidicola]KAA9152093.1 S8 family serine peptidase [Amycolatopsis acidicola]